MITRVRVRKMLKKGIALLIAFLLLLCGVRMTEAAALEERMRCRSELDRIGFSSRSTAQFSGVSSSRFPSLPT